MHMEGSVSHCPVLELVANIRHADSVYEASLISGKVKGRPKAKAKFEANLVFAIFLGSLVP